jgi:hypothetical protein
MAYLSQLRGTQDNGDTVAVPATSEGHLEVAIHAPRLPFGSVHTENMLPIFQSDAVYGINASEEIATTSLNGAATGTSNLFRCATGTNANAFASIQSRKRLRYRAGQGVICRFTGVFDATVSNSIVVAGCGSGEDGFFFGYYNIAALPGNSTEFGILWSRGGKRAIRTLTVSTKSSGTQDVQVVLNDVSFTVTGITNGTNATETAYQISRGTFAGWRAEQRGATVVFLSNDVGAKSGAYSVAQSGAGAPVAGSFATTLEGVPSSDTFIPKSTWNGDKLDGTGASGVTLNPQYGNVYQIGIQYLGFGSIVFQVEAGASPNNPDFTVVHTINIPNTRTTPSVLQPSFPFTMAAYSAGSTTNVGVSVGSFAGFIEGQKKLTGPRMSYFTTTGVTSSTSAYVPIFTVRNDSTYATRANQSVGQLLSCSGSSKSQTGQTAFFLIRNATLTGIPNFAAWSTSSSTYVDTAATGCSFSANEQVIWSATTTGDGQFAFSFSDDVTLQPGETVTFAVRSITATATCMGQLNTREDQ